MYYFKNMVLRKYILRYFVVFILAFVSQAHAGDTEIVSLFTPSAPENEVAVNAAIPDRYQDITVNTAPLKTESEERSRIRIDFLDQSIVARRMKFIPGPHGSFTWIGKPENMDGSVVMSVCGNTLFGLIEFREESYKIETVRGTNTHRIFNLDTDESAPIDYGGVVPQEDELREKMGVIPGISKGIDDGTFF